MSQRITFSPRNFGLCMILLTTLLTLITNSLMHELSHTYAPIQIIFFKGVLGLLSLSIFYRNFTIVMQNTTLWGWHFVRACIGVLGNFLWIHALSKLLMANATALGLTSALWSMLGAWFLLKESYHISRICALLLGLWGSLMIIRPGAAHFSVDSLLPLGSALCFAISDLILRYTGQKDDVRVSVFVLTSVMIVWSLCSLNSCWIMPSGMDGLWLSIIGLGYGWGQLCLAKAYSLLEASYLAPFKFIRYPATLCIGLLFFTEIPDRVSLWGGGMIVLALMGMWWWERVFAKESQKN